jgi:hypothetical protein
MKEEGTYILTYVLPSSNLTALAPALLGTLGADASGPAHIYP